MSRATDLHDSGQTADWTPGPVAPHTDQSGPQLFDHLIDSGELDVSAIEDFVDDAGALSANTLESGEHHESQGPVKEKRKRPPRPRASRLRRSHCKNCKADTQNPRWILGIGEMCRSCAPRYQMIGDLVEIIDGQRCADREDLFRSMVRAAQQLNFEYQIVGQGAARKISLGEARYTPFQMLQVYCNNRYQYEALVREQLQRVNGGWPYPAQPVQWEEKQQDHSQNAPDDGS